MKATPALMLILTTIAVILLLFLLVLLFQPQERNGGVEPEREPVNEAVSQPSTATTVDPVSPVPQSDIREDLPLGSDLDMEFPTLEE